MDSVDKTVGLDGLCVTGGRLNLGKAMALAAGVCLPICHKDYDEWVLMGRPLCWCYSPYDGTSYQCDGDADGRHSGGLLKYRVYTGDLNIVVANWKKKDADLPGNCASCERGEQAKAGELTFEDLVKWLEDIWLDPEVRQAINEDTWLKFIESLMGEQFSPE